MIEVSAQPMFLFVVLDSVHARSFLNVALALRRRGIQSGLLFVEFSPGVIGDRCIAEGIPWARLPVQQGTLELSTERLKKSLAWSELASFTSGLIQEWGVCAVVMGRTWGGTASLVYDLMADLNVHFAAIECEVWKLPAEIAALRYDSRIALYCFASLENAEALQGKVSAANLVSRFTITGSPYLGLDRPPPRDSRKSDHLRLLLCLHTPESDLGPLSYRKVSRYDSLITQVSVLDHSRTYISLPDGSSGLKLARILRARFGNRVKVTVDSDAILYLRFADAVITSDLRLASLGVHASLPVFYLDYLKGRFPDFQDGESRLRKWLVAPSIPTDSPDLLRRGDGGEAERCAEELQSLIREAAPRSVAKAASLHNRAIVPQTGIGPPISVHGSRLTVAVISQDASKFDYETALSSWYRPRVRPHLVRNVQQPPFVELLTVGLAEAEADIVYLAAPGVRPEMIARHAGFHLARRHERLVGLSSMRFPILQELPLGRILAESHHCRNSHALGPKSPRIGWGMSFSREACDVLRALPLEAFEDEEYSCLAYLRKAGFSFELVEGAEVVVQAGLNLGGFLKRIQETATGLAMAVAKACGDAQIREILIDPICIEPKQLHKWRDISREELGLDDAIRTIDLWDAHWPQSLADFCSPLASDADIAELRSAFTSIEGAIFRKRFAQKYLALAEGM